MTRWEYLTVSWSETRTEISHPDGSASDWKWERKLEVYWPGSDEGEIAGKITHTWFSDNKPGDFEVTEEGVKMNALLNKLGAEGWEVVTSTIQSTAVSTERGYPAAGRPISTSTLLKRPID
jgi:hypothetical protein